MSGNTNQKTKILYLMKILMEETDELHPLTIKELVTKLDQYNIQDVYKRQFMHRWRQNRERLRLPMWWTA